MRRLSLRDTLRSRDSEYYAAKCEFSEWVWKRIHSRRNRSGTSPYSLASNVVGVGISQKFSDGEPKGIPCIKILVKKKPVRKATVPKWHRIPKTLAGLPTDVRESGTIRLLNDHPGNNAGNSTAADLQPGCSIGYSRSGSRPNAGTLGALVKMDDSEDTFLLSNAHVLADLGDLSAPCETTQPGSYDQPAPTVVGQLTKSEFLGPGRNIDAAIARIVGDFPRNPDIIEVGAIAGHGPATDLMVVEKYGKKSRRREGIVTNLLEDPFVNIPGRGLVRFTDQIAIEGLFGVNFSEEGDSGSIVVETETNMAVGLLFSREATGVTYANHIGVVLSRLGVKFVT